MIKLSPADNAFLQVERPQTPMHVGGLTIHTISKNVNKAEFMNRVVNEFGQVLAQVPAFRSRLEYSSLLKLDVPVLTPDPHFDLSYHVRPMAVPAPCEIDQVMDYVARVHGLLMDRARPLWELHVIEGIKGRRFGLYLKVHHSIMDGISAINLMKQYFSNDPDDTKLKQPAAKKKKKRNANKAAGNLLEKGMGLVAKGQKEVSKAVDLAGMFTHIGKELIRSEKVVPPWYSPQKSPLNVELTGRRNVAVTSFSLSGFKELGKTRKATINDVILAVSAGALRRFLKEKGSLPKKAMVANIPVYIKPADGVEQVGNAISSINCSLGTHIDDPVKRLEHIRNSTFEGKSQLMAMSKDAIDTYNLMMAGPFIAAQLLNITPKIRVPFNILVSNVPTSHDKLYLMGAEMESLYGLNLIFQMQALNVTVTTYCDSADFTLMACRKTMPDLDIIIRYLQDAYAELRAALLG
ncbi:wax ester/triacylglycerol synthase family O-acyltransferase [Desulfobacterales bacterium HSG17]|nr:wax ester/triacylglycerol synthase family O-acyltransferase [Desulfobacterales bacterium HSG17]